MVRHRSLAIAAVLALAAVQRLPAQIQDWQNQWYWGAKGGVVRYTLPNYGGTVTRPQAGGEWMITARHAALYVGYSTTFTRDADSIGISGFSQHGWVGFDAMQRIQVALLVFPWGGHIQPYLGGGFMIETLSNATLDQTGWSSATQWGKAQDTVFQYTSGGFALAMAGVQIRLGRLAVYGQAQISPQGRGFFLRNSSQSIEFGVRYAFLGSHEEDVTTRR